MSINSEIERIKDNVSDALAATAEMGATVPATANSNDLGTLIRSIPKGGGSSSWDDITDKPFTMVGGDTLTWDGDTTGLVNVANTFYLVSDALLTVADINNGNGGTWATFSDGTEAQITATALGNTVMLTKGTSIAGAYALVDNASDGLGTFPKAGLYLYRVSSNPYVTSLTVNGYTGFDVKEKIDPSCLPDGYPYSETGVAILPETTVEIDPDSGEGYILDEFELVGGNTYTVMWNGMEYSCVAQPLVDDSGVYGAAVGDVGLVDVGEPVTGEPFVIISFIGALAAEYGVYGVVVALDGSESVTLSINGEVVHKLDAKYLPDTTFLYVSLDDDYLYKNKSFGDENNRVTNDYLRSLFVKPGKVLICGDSVWGNGSEVIPTTLYIDIAVYMDATEFGMAITTYGNKTYYTAEYTG